jgi:hypothetical protein
MTLENFLSQLSRHAGRYHSWELVSDGDPCVGRIRIHMSNGGNPLVQCPITAVCSLVRGRYWGAGEWRDAARILDLPISLAGRIKSAADNRPECDDILRKRIAVAVGIRLIRFESRRQEIDLIV